MQKPGDGETLTTFDVELMIDPFSRVAEWASFSRSEADHR